MVTWVLLLAWLSLASHVAAKVTKGDFQLSGVNTEVVLTSFAMLTDGGSLEVDFEADRMYENTQRLFLRIYKEEIWRKFQKETLCSKRIQLAVQSHNLVFQQDKGSWKSRAVLDVPAHTSKAYWYFAVDDCSLEEYFHDNAIPKVKFEAKIRNKVPRRRGKSFKMIHFGADERHLVALHLFCFLLSGFLCFFLTMRVILKLNLKSSNHTVHIAVVWVTVSVALDCLSSFFELVHLQTYYRNGIGLYFFDALAAHCEAICDASIMLLLLSIACGWTLPSSNINVVASPSRLQEMIHDFSRLSGMSGFLAVGIVVLHMVLAQLQRTYNDDFDSYHDLDHLPGRTLIAMRCCMGLIFSAAVLQTSKSSLRDFYRSYLVAGSVWFISPLVLTLVCSVSSLTLRKPIMFYGGAVMQFGSLVSLSWLVSAHNSTFHKYSRMGNQAPGLTESLSNDVGKTWSFGKAKLRLD